jgi:hypothetical protein
MRVGFSKTTDAKKPSGWINYDEETKELSIEYDGDASKLKKYLTTTREFRIPESQRIDDFRVDNAKPTESRVYLELALCTAYARIGFFILWDTEEN